MAPAIFVRSLHERPEADIGPSLECCVASGESCLWQLLQRNGLQFAMRYPYALTTRRSKRSDAIPHKISGGGPQLTGMRNM